MKKREEKNSILQPGDVFTMSGYGTGRSGQKVVAGRNVATGRNCRAVVLTKFVITSNVVGTLSPEEGAK